MIPTTNRGSEVKIQRRKSIDEAPGLVTPWAPRFLDLIIRRFQESCYERKSCLGDCVLLPEPIEFDFPSITQRARTGDCSTTADRTQSAQRAWKDPREQCGWKGDSVALGSEDPSDSNGRERAGARRIHDAQAIARTRADTRCLEIGERLQPVGRARAR